MNKTGKYAYDLVKKMSFVRFGGTEQELAAANILLEEIRRAGGEGQLMDFSIPAYEITAASLAVSAPYTRTIEAVAYGRSGEISPDTELDFYYLERGVEEDYYGLGDLSNACVMINDYSYDAYKQLCKHKPAAFITIAGKYYDTAANSDLVPRSLRDTFLKFGKIPGFAIRAKDAMELVRRDVKNVRLTLQQQETEHTSRNVLAVIPGTEKQDEDIVLTAHYDSVLVGTGSWDNATGSAALMLLYRHFLKNPPKRTLRFIWCGAEEQGLLGSKAYIEQNPEIVKNIRFCFNFDMCGTILGPDHIFATGGDDLKYLAQQFCKEQGISADVTMCVHSSDSAPFCDKGIPALGLSRGTRTAEIHTRNDKMPPLSAYQLGRMGQWASAFVEKIANAAMLPIPMGMPPKMLEELDKYFRREKDTKEGK